MWRKSLSKTSDQNCPGVDINRNFGYRWGGKFLFNFCLIKLKLSFQDFNMWFNDVLEESFARLPTKSILDLVGNLDYSF